jgi:hypothetical protein
LSKGKFGSRVGLTAWVSNTTSQVLPSGGAFATSALPDEPEAPGRFSTTTVTPSRCCRPADASRPTASTEAPAGNGTTIGSAPTATLRLRGAARPCAEHDRTPGEPRHMLSFA